MARSGLTWRTAKPPPNTAVFAIGDIHANDQMLGPLLEGIEEKIKEIHQDTPNKKIFVIGIGDYIDRGESAQSTQRTIDMLMDFEQSMQEKYQGKVETVMLCGNHDEGFKRLLDAKAITTEMEVPDDPSDHRNIVTRKDGTISLSSFAESIHSGGVDTTLKDYCPSISDEFLERANLCRQPQKVSPELLSQTADEANVILKELQQNVPDTHKRFFDKVYDNDHLILGDFLFTHAGVEPDKTMEEQHIGTDNTPEPLDKFKRHMIRDPFLWRDRLDNCPYVVVHGHTPSVITKSENSSRPIIHPDNLAKRPDRIVDPQKPYRMCIDTDVYSETGSLTAMVHDGRDLTFMAVNHQDPSYVAEYSIAPNGAEKAAEQHRNKHPKYHPGGERYFGDTPRTWANWARHSLRRPQEGGKGYSTDTNRSWTNWVMSSWGGNQVVR